MRSFETIREGYEVVVVGGGLAGIAAAVAAARQGHRTVLVHNRPVLGGNSSAEIGVPPHGADQLGSYRHVRETGIIDEIAAANAAFPNHLDSPSIWSMVLWAFCRRVENLTVYLNTHVDELAMEGGRIVLVRAQQQTTERKFEFGGKVFIDCSGDGVVGYLSGADFMIGREARREFDEYMAPEEADDYRMGNSVYIRARDVGREVPFPAPDWIHQIPSDDALPDKGTTCPHPIESLTTARGGWWWIETGGQRDTIGDAEIIRDELYRYAVGMWDHMKNRGEHGAGNYVLESISTMPGKRESRRFNGDYVLTQSDVQAGRIFEDAVAYAGWHIDVHRPEGIAGKMYWYGKLLNGVFTIPYRSLYSRNIDNLLFAGRNISASHVAFGSTRVMLTCAIMGQAVGNAAALCLRHGCSPREIHKSHMGSLRQELLRQDCYIPGARDESEGNHARAASVRASSEKVLESGSVEEYHALNVPRGQMFVLSEKSLAKVGLPLENTTSKTIELEIRLRAARRVDDFTSRDDVALARADVPPGRSVVDFDFGIELPAGQRPYWVQLPAREGLAWGFCRREEPAGQAASTKEQYFTDPGTELLMHRKRGTYGFSVTPVSRCYGPEQVVSGVGRPEAASNIWISGPGLPQWIELSWKKPVALREIHLTFDNQLDRPIAEWAKQGPAKELLRDYVVSLSLDGKEVGRIPVWGNRHRKRVHHFGTVTATGVRLTAEAGWGADEARVFEIRAY